MPPVAPTALRPRPAYIRHLLLSNRVRIHDRNSSNWFKNGSIENTKPNTPTKPRPKKRPSTQHALAQQPTTPSPAQRPYKDPIPRKEDILKDIDEDDIMKAFSKGPGWFEDIINPNKVQRVVFEEDPDDEEGGRGRNRRTMHSIDAQERQLKRKIKHLEKQLGLDKDEWHFHRKAYAELPPEAKEGFLTTTGKTKEEVEGDEVLMPATELQTSTLDGLNECLVKAGKNPSDHANNKQLWRYYCRCKWRIPNFLTEVTDRVWTLLWQTQDIDSAHNPHRFSHLKILGEDMESVGKERTIEQDTKIVEAVFKTGEEDEALWVWEEWYEKIVNDDELPTPEAMELGIFMHCKMGNSERAEELLKLYFETYPKPNPRAAIPLIEAFVQHKDEYAQRQALLVYMKMQERLGSKITMKDYDTVSSIFFAAELPVLALVVFTDMMNDPQSPFRGPDLVERAVNRAKELMQLSDTAAETNTISLTLMGVLPRRMQNKYFVGAWLKKLIGLGELKAAGQVIELMFERGVQVAPLHLNGLCSALFSSKEKTDQARAERMIWAMIRQRIRLVEQRNNDRLRGVFRPDLPHKILYDESGTAIPKHLERSMPAATTETLGVLAQRYRRVGKTALVSKLNDLLRVLQLQMSPFFLTQYLYAKMALVKDHKNLWVLFRDITVWHSPSVASYEVMWKSVLYRIEKSRFKAGSLTPQELFSHMTAWWQGLTEDRKHIETKSFRSDIYNLVLHVFLRLRDLPGAIVAMHAMKEMVGRYPDGETTKEVVRGLAILSFKVPTSGLQRVRVMLSRNFEENTQATFVVLQALYEEMTGKDFVSRFEGSRIPDDNYGDPDQLLTLLTQLVWVFAARTMEADALRRAVWIAKNNMGVENLRVGTTGAFAID